MPCAPFHLRHEAEHFAEIAELVAGESRISGLGDLHRVGPGPPLRKRGDARQDRPLAGDVVGDEAATSQMRIEVVPLVHQRLEIGGERRSEEPLAGLDHLKVADEREAELPRLVASAVLVTGRFEVYRREFHWCWIVSNPRPAVKHKAAISLPAIGRRSGHTPHTHLR